MREWQPDLGLQHEASHLRLVETENDDSRSFRRETNAYKQQAERFRKSSDSSDTVDEGVRYFGAAGFASGFFTAGSSKTFSVSSGS